MNVYIDVIDQKLITNKNLNGFVAGTEGFIKFIFNLTDEWKKLELQANFVQGSKVYEVKVDEDQSAILPSNIEQGWCQLTVKGKKDKVVAISETIYLKIKENGIDHYISPKTISNSIATGTPQIKLPGSTGIASKAVEILKEE